MTPKTVSTPRSPRLVTVMVGSAISARCRRPARARATRSRSRSMSWSSARVSASWMAGATRPPCRRATATPRCTAGLGWNAPSTKKPLTVRDLLGGHRGGLQQQGRGNQPRGDRPLGVDPLHPGHGGAQVERGAQVVVGDLPLGTGHQRATARRRLATRSAASARPPPAGCRRASGRRPLPRAAAAAPAPRGGAGRTAAAARPRMSASVTAPSGPVPGPAEVHAELGGQPTCRGATTAPDVPRGGAGAAAGAGTGAASGTGRGLPARRRVRRRPG